MSATSSMLGSLWYSVRHETVELLLSMALFTIATVLMVGTVVVF